MRCKHIWYPMKTRLYLDTRGSKEKAEYPVKVAINSRGSSAYIVTGVSVAPQNWDAKNGKVVGTPLAPRLNLVLSERKLAVDRKIEALRDTGELKGASAAGIRAAVVGGGDGDDEKEITFLRCLDIYASTKDRARTIQTFRDTKRRIQAFTDRADSLLFSDITPAWLADFDAFLAKTNRSANSRGVYMRCIRAVFNYAKGEELTEAHYPFRKFKIRREATKDRSLTAEELRTIMAAPCTGAVAKSRDIFLLSFFLCGINIADLMALTEIKNGRIEFNRIKTGQPISIGVQPEAMEIIERYRGEHFLLDIAETWHGHKNYLRRLNDHLKAIWREAYGVERAEISYYYARYAWATIAAELDIPERTIGGALGHGTAKSVTSIYTRVDMRRKIDAANRRVIDYIFTK